MQFTHKTKPGISLQNDMTGYTKKIFNTLTMHKDDHYVNIKNTYPSATSSIIISTKPSAKTIVPILECGFSDISGISSSTTT